MTSFLLLISSKLGVYWGKSHSNSNYRSLTNKSVTQICFQQKPFPAGLDYESKVGVEHFMLTRPQLEKTGGLCENLPARLDVVFGCECRGATKFSDCSDKNFESLIQRGGGACLRNPPSQDDIISVARCGNGILESEEECDCGTPKVCFKIQDI